MPSSASPRAINTTSTRRANAIAFDVREKGRIKRAGNPLTGEIVRDASGEPVWEPGTLECVKAIGWYIEEYGIAQISMNLTNIRTTPVHVAFDEVCRRAEARGVRVTGSELVGLIPLEAMLDAIHRGLVPTGKAPNVLGQLLAALVRTLEVNEEGTELLPRLGLGFHQRPLMGLVVAEPCLAVERGVVDARLHSLLHGIQGVGAVSRSRGLDGLPLSWPSRRWLRVLEWPMRKPTRCLGDSWLEEQVGHVLFDGVGRYVHDGRFGGDFHYRAICRSDLEGLYITTTSSHGQADC